MARGLRHYMVTTAVLMAFGCASVSVSIARESVESQGVAAGALPVAMAGTHVLAVVNGKNITAGELENELANLPDHLKEIGQTPEGRKELLDTMVVRELILQQAAAQGIDKRKEIDEKLADLKKRIIVEAYLKEKMESAPAIPEADLKKHYNENKNNYMANELRVSQIVVKEEAKANELAKKINDGTKFEDVAKQSSIGPAAASGGDLGWFKEENVPEEFVQVLFQTDGSSLNEGDVSTVFQSAKGYSIIKLTGVRQFTRSFEEVRERIVAEMKAGRQSEIFEGIKADLRKKAKIVINGESR